MEHSGPLIGCALELNPHFGTLRGLLGFSGCGGSFPWRHVFPAWGAICAQMEQIVRESGECILAASCVVGRNHDGRLFVSRRFLNSKDNVFYDPRRHSELGVITIHQLAQMLTKLVRIG